MQLAVEIARVCRDLLQLPYTKLDRDGNLRPCKTFLLVAIAALLRKFDRLSRAASGDWMHEEDVREKDAEARVGASVQRMAGKSEMGNTIFDGAQAPRGSKPEPERLKPVVPRRTKVRYGQVQGTALLREFNRFLRAASCDYTHEGHVREMQAGTQAGAPVQPKLVHSARIKVRHNPREERTAI